MKIYLAGPCDSENRTMMINIARVLKELNYEVYCPWELKIENAWDYTQEEWAQKVFDADVKAIKNCDMVIMISYGRISTAGTNWEQGFAYALNKPIYVFQITDNSTSLMTFCGCSEFWNTNKHEISYQIKKVMIYFKENGFILDKKWCTTTLT